MVTSDDRSKAALWSAIERWGDAWSERDDRPTPAMIAREKLWRAHVDTLLDDLLQVTGGTR